MRRENVRRAAEVVSTTGWSSFTGKRPTTEELLNDIDRIFGAPEISSVAEDLYRGSMEVISQMPDQNVSLEVTLRYLLDYHQQLSEQQGLSYEQWASLSFLGTLASVRAVLTHFEAKEEKVSMRTIRSIIESVDLKMSKNDLRKAYGDMEALPPHPQQNAIGFATVIDGIESAVICYFQKKLLNERLGAITIVIYEEPPPPEELERTYQNIVEQLSQGYGQPQLVREDYIVWETGRFVIYAGKTNGIIGIRFGNPKIDPFFAQLLRK